jgi:hypothetical protein
MLFCGEYAGEGTTRVLRTLVLLEEHVDEITGRVYANCHPKELAG